MFPTRPSKHVFRAIAQWQNQRSKSLDWQLFSASRQFAQPVSWVERDTEYEGVLFQLFTQHVAVTLRIRADQLGWVYGVTENVYHEIDDLLPDEASVFEYDEVDHWEPYLVAALDKYSELQDIPRLLWLPMPPRRRDGDDSEDDTLLSPSPAQMATPFEPQRSLEAALQSSPLNLGPPLVPITMWSTSAGSLLAANWRDNGKEVVSRQPVVAAAAERPFARTLVA